MVSISSLEKWNGHPFKGFMLKNDIIITISGGKNHSSWILEDGFDWSQSGSWENQLRDNIFSQKIYMC